MKQSRLCKWKLQWMYVHFVAVAVCVGSLYAFGDVSENTPLKWEKVIEAIKADDSLHEAVKYLVREARQEAGKGIIRRP